MPLIDIYLAQLTDIFRIGLLIALLLTAANTAQAMNRWIPIALGLVFVAVLIPSSFGAKEGQDTTTAIGVGLLSNATILAILLAGQQIYRRLAR